MASAPASSQARLLDLQALDTQLQQITHARAGIAERREAVNVAAELEVTQDRAVAAATEASDIARLQARADDDVQAVRTRIERDKQLMDSGSVAAKELENLAHEIESLKRRQTELEDAELEIMERLESAQTAHAAYLAQVDELQARLTSLQGVVAARETELATQEQQTQTDRTGVAAEIPADLLALYDKVRAAGGVGAALLRQKSCQGCRITLPESEITRLRAADPDSVERCDNCRCILVRTEESGL